VKNNISEEYKICVKIIFLTIILFYINHILKYED